MTLKGWRVIKPQHNQFALNKSVMYESSLFSLYCSKVAVGKLSDCSFVFRQEVSDAYNREEELPENHLSTDDVAKLTLKQVQ